MQDMTEGFFAYRDHMNKIVAELKHVPAGMMEMCFENLQAIHHDVSEKHMQLKEVLVSHRNPVSAPQQIQQPGGHPPSMQPQLQEQTQQQQSQEERPEKRPRQL